LALQENLLFWHHFAFGVFGCAAHIRDASHANSSSSPDGFASIDSVLSCDFDHTEDPYPSSSSISDEFSKLGRASLNRSFVECECGDQAGITGGNIGTFSVA